MNVKKPVVVAIAIAAATLMTACSGNSTSARNTSADKPIVNKDNWPAQVPRQGLARNMVLPLEKYMLSYADRVTLDQATTDLQQKCMAGYGFHVTLPEPGANPPPSTDDADMERRYGITDPNDAAKYGYELAPKFRGHTSQSVPDLPGVQVEVLTGHTKPVIAHPKDGKSGFYVTPNSVKPARTSYNGKALKKGGCVGWSKEQIKLDDSDALFVSQLAGKSLTGSQRDGGVKKAIRAWSSCMDAKGHKNLADPYEAMAQGVTDGRASKSRDSVKLAVDDVACKQRTNLVRIWFDAESKIENKQIADNKAELEAIASRHGKALSVARAQQAA
ncbi:MULTISPECIES: hypothetical protein [Streptomyces]|uniref:PknH-like extracellular domain-containing protein n=1 Tax=Streptomyces chartreusis NRRL 3882 TaxID=1079985 RepID=A0A2N9B1M9_STRCX|nr:MULTISPECIES: hypothetical protein [Streptomyces]MYS93626.1 hypothetical protein [Streptomyces sp. SID5464]SOR77246.1 hypothetical protein SCNRRL3882_0721 [Streptomyces chartreusis NRRL 3882]